MSKLNLYIDNIKQAEIRIDRSRVSLSLVKGISAETKAAINNSFMSIGPLSEDSEKQVKAVLANSGLLALNEQELAFNSDSAIPLETQNSQRNEAKFIYESNLIEDIAFTNYQGVLDQVNQQSNLGHVGAWNYFKVLGLTQQSLTVENLNLANQLLMREQVANGMPIDEKYIGQPRSEQLYIDGRIINPPSEIQLANFLQSINQQISSLPKDPNSIIKFAAHQHLEFELIHPFADGNGRLGRIIFNYILAFHKIKPIVFTSSDKQTYYQIFEAETHDLQLLKAEQYCLSRLEKNI